MVTPAIAAAASGGRLAPPTSDMLIDVLNVYSAHFRPSIVCVLPVGVTAPSNFMVAVGASAAGAGGFCPAVETRAVFWLWSRMVTCLAAASVIVDRLAGMVVVPMSMSMRAFMPLMRLVTVGDGTPPGAIVAAPPSTVVFCTMVTSACTTAEHTANTRSVADQRFIQTSGPGRMTIVRYLQPA